MVINRQETLLESHSHNFPWDFLNIHNTKTNVSNCSLQEQAAGKFFKKLET